MSKRQIKLSDHFDEFVEQQVATGRYKNAGEVLRAGLRVLEQQTREDEEKLTILRKLASEAFDAMDRGEIVTLEDESSLAEFVSASGRRAARRAGNAGA